MKRMEPKWAFAVRSGELHVDKKAASGAIASGVGLYFLAEMFIPGVWSHVVVVLFAVASIALGVWMGRRELKADRLETRALDAASPRGPTPRDGR